MICVMHHDPEKFETIMIRSYHDELENEPFLANAFSHNHYKNTRYWKIT